METMFSVKRDQLTVEISRIFQAAPERLWQAVTNSDEIPKWWGPAQYETVVARNDVTVGGAWRFTQTAEDGTVHAFRGEYKELDKPHKIVRTFEYEPMAGHVLTETLTLEAVGENQTKMTTTAQYENIGDLEGMVSMGMESGEREGYERLAALVE
jgi:uncharacterized protein YndB with AHSA1/START domain